MKKIWQLHFDALLQIICSLCITALMRLCVRISAEIVSILFSVTIHVPYRCFTDGSSGMFDGLPKAFQACCCTEIVDDIFLNRFKGALISDFQSSSNVFFKDLTLNCMW